MHTHLVNPTLRFITLEIRIFATIEYNVNL